jgi:hypothetical protein
MSGDADVDPDEFPPDAATAIDSAAFVEAVDDAAAELPDAVPIEADTPRPEVTGRHNTLTPAQFASAIDLTDRDAYARGDAAGYARGLVEGRADVKQDDWLAGVEDAMSALRMYLFSEGIVHVDEFAAKVQAFIKRS